MRTTLHGFFLLLFAIGSCGKEASSLPTVPNEEVLGDELERSFPGLVEKARQQLEQFSDLDLSNLTFELTSGGELLETLVDNVSLQNSDSGVELSRADLKPMSRGMVGIYDIQKGEILIVLDNLKWLADTFDRPSAYNTDILFAVLVHEGSHAVADRKYGLAKLVQGCKNTSELVAANAVIEGYAQYLARKICASVDMDAGIQGLTELITTVPEIEDAVQRMAMEFLVQQFSYAYVEGEVFIQEIVKTNGVEGIAKAFSHPPTSRNLVTNPEWYLDPSKRPDSSFKVKAGLDHFDAYFADQDFLLQRMDFDESMLRTAASSLPSEDIERYADAVLQSRVTLGAKMNFFGQALAVAALHQCQDKNHAELLVQLTRDLIKAKESVSKDTASPIIKSEWEEIDEKDIIGFRVNQVVNSNGIKTPTQSQLVRRGSFVCEITLIQIQTPKEELLGLAKEILTIALSQSETIEEK